MLVFQGKLTFSDIVPGLARASEQITARIPDYQAMVDKAAQGVSWLDKKVEAAQAEADRINDVLAEARSAVESANKILDEARGLLNKVSSALNDSGIYLYTYVGEVGDLPDDLADEFYQYDGLRDSAGTQHESIAATLIIVGGDGDLLHSANKIKRLFTQIGGNGQAVADLFRAENNLPIDDDPELPWD